MQDAVVQRWGLGMYTDTDRRETLRSTTENLKIRSGRKPECFLRKKSSNLPAMRWGGVCAFGITNSNVKIYCDLSLKRFDTVFPACGSSNSAIELSCDELFSYSGAQLWVDVCKLPQTEASGLCSD